MVKKLCIIFILLLGYCYWIYTSRPTMTSPYPYYFVNNDYAESAAAAESHILILGDGMGKNLTFYSPELMAEVSLGLTRPLTTYNWSGENDGLHRSLSKLRSLKKFPKIVIYHGGNKDFYEKKFSLKDFHKIKKNFALTRDDFLASVILTFPILSKFFYEKVDLIKFKPNVFMQDTIDYKGKAEQYHIDLGYKIYQHELRELYRLSREHNFTLIIITNPINLEIPAKKVCENAQTRSLKKYQQYIQEKADDGDLKENYIKLKKLKENTVGNAKTYFLFGQTALKLGKLAQAKQALQLATAFDCARWRGTHVHNELLRQFAKNNELYLIDFDQIVNHKLGREELFINQFLPKNIYYLSLMQDLRKYIVEIYQL